MSSMTRPTLYLFVGYPGAGKTTIAKIIADATDGVHLWADMERHVMFGTPSHTRTESRELYDHLNTVTDQLLAEGRCVVFDTNFNFRKDRDHMRKIAAKHGAEVRVVWVTTPRDIARHRATEDSDGKPTRIWGNMRLPDFNRLSDNLQTPDDDEDVIRIDGSETDVDAVRQKLGLS
jgi:predicted kinase